MITPDYCQMMARYNAWQNRGVIDAFAALTADQLATDHGGFWGGMLATANHIIWGDMLWMSRFDGGAGPGGGFKISTSMSADAQEYTAIRIELDDRISRWAAQVREPELTGDLTWHSGAMQAEVTRSMAMCVTHFFNHQTHHRGQIHGMLTSVGWKTQDSDLFFMDETS